MFAEYPKALYKGGVVAEGGDADYVQVEDADQEAEKNAEGWFELGKAPAEGEAAEPVARKPGRHRKTEG